MVTVAEDMLHQDVMLGQSACDDMRLSTGVGTLSDDRTVLAEGDNWPQQHQATSAGRQAM
jgi:hypothetical protein